MQKEENPQVEADRATFFWHGEDAPMIIGDFTSWEWGQPVQMTKRKAGLWAAEVPLLSDSYMEYAFWDGKQRVADPRNSRTTPDGFGHRNHYFYMPEGQPTLLTASPGGFPAGTVGRYELPCRQMLTGKTRTVYLYQPPVEEAVPLWVVWDGREYMKRAYLCNIVDNLIIQGRIRPVALALVNNGGPNRSIEYLCSDSTLGFVQEVLLPFAGEKLNLIDIQKQPGAYGVLGASMGGLMALYAGLRIPQIFGQVLSQSGGFELGETRPVVHDLIEYGPLRPVQIWMDTGRYEWLLEPNRRMHTLLRGRGYDVTYREFSAGHNYPAWRDDVWRGLEHLLPAQQSQMPYNGEQRVK